MTQFWRCVRDEVRASKGKVSGALSSLRKEHLFASGKLEAKAVSVFLHARDCYNRYGINERSWAVFGGAKLGGVIGFLCAGTYGMNTGMVTGGLVGAAFGQAAVHAVTHWMDSHEPKNRLGAEIQAIPVGQPAFVPVGMVGVRPSISMRMNR